MKINQLVFLTLLFSLFVQLGVSQSVDGRNRYKRSVATFDMKVGVLGGFGRSWNTGSDFVVRSNFEGDDFESFTKFKGKFGGNVGLFTDVKFSTNSYIQLEARLTANGWKQEGQFAFSPANALIDSFPNFNKVEFQANVLWLDIPLRYKVKLASGFFALAGPYVGIKISEKYKLTDDFGVKYNDLNTFLPLFDSFNYGLALGFSYQMKTGLLFMFDYQHGIADLANYGSVSGVPEPKYHQVYGSFSVGYLFNYFNRFTNYKRRGRGKL